MKSILELTNREAIRVTQILGVEFHRFHASKEHSLVVIVLENEPGKREENIYIYPTGKVSLLYNDGEPGGSGYEDINTLPVTDYLRAQGYEFEYSVPAE